MPCRVVFEPGYRVAEAVRGLEGFDFVWLLWGFHLNGQKDEKSKSIKTEESWSPTVRPPRLGGNKRVGVFASRSPFRPNPIGLSSVRLLHVGTEPGLGPVLTVAGADLVDGTPIFDIKPYVAYADSHEDARSGFAAEAPRELLTVSDPEGCLSGMPDGEADALRKALAQDPRPHYQDDPGREYGMLFGDREVKFRVVDGAAVIVGLSAV